MHCSRPQTKSVSFLLNWMLCTQQVHGVRTAMHGMDVYAGEDAMTEDLTKLVEAARRRPFPEEEREAQRRSFAYGNARIENDRVTWDMIVEADERIKAELAAAK